MSLIIILCSDKKCPYVGITVGWHKYFVITVKFKQELPIPKPKNDTNAKNEERKKSAPSQNHMLSKKFKTQPKPIITNPKTEICI